MAAETTMEVQCYIFKAVLNIALSACIFFPAFHNLLSEVQSESTVWRSWCQENEMLEVETGVLLLMHYSQTGPCTLSLLLFVLLFFHCDMFGVAGGEAKVPRQQKSSPTNH